MGKGTFVIKCMLAYTHCHSANKDAINTGLCTQHTKYQPSHVLIHSVEASNIVL